MKCYTVGEMQIGDSGWIADYVANVTAMVERRGGRYLARTGRVERIEGEDPPAQFWVLIEWPSREVADEFYASEEYRPYREARLQGASNQFTILAGEDVNRAARVQ